MYPHRQHTAGIRQYRAGTFYHVMHEVMHQVLHKTEFRWIQPNYVYCSTGKALFGRKKIVTAIDRIEYQVNTGAAAFLMPRKIIKRYDGLGNAVLARVHLYVNLESGHNHTNPGDGTTESLDVKHHCYHVVVHRRQRIRTPTVIHAAAFRQS